MIHEEILHGLLPAAFSTIEGTRFARGGSSHMKKVERADENREDKTNRPKTRHSRNHTKTPKPSRALQRASGKKSTRKH